MVNPLTRFPVDLMKRDFTCRVGGRNQSYAKRNQGYLQIARPKRTCHVVTRIQSVRVRCAASPMGRSIWVPIGRSPTLKESRGTKPPQRLSPDFGGKTLSPETETAQGITFSELLVLHLTSGIPSFHQDTRYPRSSRCCCHRSGNLSELPVPSREHSRRTR